MQMENNELLELLERLTEFVIQLEKRIDRVELVLKENDYETLCELKKLVTKHKGE